MKRRDWIVLAVLQRYGYRGRNALRERVGLPVEYLEDSLNTLQAEGYLTPELEPTEKTAALLEHNRPRRAVILAAGAGVRMLPSRTPKGLLTLNDEALIERMIDQLHTAGIFEIWAVVGYRKEEFEYLEDKYGVQLIVNESYDTRDSLHSLALALDHCSLDNCYIVPSDLWFARSPFSETEYFSWYAVSGIVDDDSCVRLNRNQELVRTDGGRSGNAMLGLCYLLPEEAAVVERHLRRMDAQRRYAKAGWEEALFRDGKMLPYAKVMMGQPHFVVKTFEQISDMEDETEQRRTSLLSYIAKAIHVEDKEKIGPLIPLKKGMTNKLTRFSCEGKEYLLRTPGEGSNQLTNRREEAAVYAALQGQEFSDRIVHIDGETGYKITQFWPGSRTCVPDSEEDVAACMALLHRFHDKGLKVDHDFDIFKRLEVYESLRGPVSCYHDYEEVRARVLSLREILDAVPAQRCLCHIDSVRDNFLFTPEGLFLIDWEYAGMCDRRADVAMFCLYAGYDRSMVDHIIDLYYGGNTDPVDRLVVYCYMSLAGLLWSQWCEYKSQFGVRYDEYAMGQYRFAKKYHDRAWELFRRLREEGAL